MNSYKKLNIENCCQKPFGENESHPAEGVELEFN